MLNMCKSKGSIPNTAKSINKKHQIKINLKSSKSPPLFEKKRPIYQVGMVKAYKIWSLLRSPVIITSTFYHSSCVKPFSALKGRSCSLLWAFTQDVSTMKNCAHVYPSFLLLSYLKFASLSSLGLPRLGIMWLVLLVLFTLGHSHLLLQLLV